MCASNGIPNVPRVAGLKSPDSSRCTAWQAFLLVAFLVWPQPLSATDFTDLLRETGSQTRDITSEKDATAFFLNTFDSSLDLPKKLRQRRDKQPALPNELARHLLPFTSNLATWNLAHDLLTAFDQGKTPTIQTILDNRQPQLEWLK